MATFTATGDWSGNATDAEINADVRFQQLGETKLVPPDVVASVVDGVLKDSDGDTGVTLPAQTGGVTVAGAAGAYVVTFTGALGGADQAQLTADDSALTGEEGDTPAVAVATTTAGKAGTDEVQSVTVSDATGGTFTLSFGGKTTAAIAYNATPAQVQAALQALSTIGKGDPVFYWAEFLNVTVAGFTVEGARFLFQADADGVDLADLCPNLAVAVSAS